MTWLESPALWIWVGSAIVQIILTWARTNVLEKNHESLERKHDYEVGALWKEVDSLREWRAQAREQFKHLEKSGPRGEESS